MVWLSVKSVVKMRMCMSEECSVRRKCWEAAKQTNNVQVGIESHSQKDGVFIVGEHWAQVLSTTLIWPPPSWYLLCDKNKNKSKYRSQRNVIYYC